MPPSPKGKRKADEDDEAAASEEAAPTKKPSASAPGPTTSAKAKAAGADSIVRSETARKPALDEAAKGLKLVHWNVGGLNAVLTKEDKKQLLLSLVAAEAPDVLAISEHKIAEGKLAAQSKALADLLPGHTAHWAVCTVKNGYSGVVCLVRDSITPPDTVAIDTVGSLHEGRTVTLEWPDVSAVAAYVPNSGQDLKRLDHRIETWEPAMRAHLKAVGEAKGKPVVLFGDLNVAHLDADIWNATAKHIAKSAGTTPKERAAFAELLGDGYVDCFRALWPDATGCFSYWSTRSGNQLLNRGLRLDYAVASASVLDERSPVRLHDCAILDQYAPNGDHAPTLVVLRRA
jgi:exodeoxyribonuclease III